MGFSHVLGKAKAGSVGVREAIKELRGHLPYCHHPRSGYHLENDNPSKQHTINSESIPRPSNRFHVNLARLLPSKKALVTPVATNEIFPFQPFGGQVGTLCSSYTVCSRGAHGHVLYKGSLATQSFS